MTRLERLFMGSYGGVAPALLGVMCVSLWRGGAFILLPAKGGHGPWVFLGIWAASATLLAALSRAGQAWRLVLLASSTGCLAVAVLAWGRSPANMLGTMAALAVLAAAGLWMACRLRFARRPTPAASRVAPHRRPHLPHRRWELLLVWLMWGIAFCVAFWDGWKGTAAPLRGAGAATLLLLVFCALPAVIVAAWRPRSAALVLGLAAALSIPLYWPQSHLGMVPPLLAVAAGALFAAAIFRSPRV